jgi:hypothetical protein
MYSRERERKIERELHNRRGGGQSLLALPATEGDGLMNWH